MKKPRKLKKGATNAQIEKKRQEIDRFKKFNTRKKTTIPNINKSIDKL